MLNQLIISELSIQYISSTSPLFESINAQIPSGWTGIAGANGIGKTTLLKAVCGNLPAEDPFVSGKIETPESCYYCPQKTDSPPESAEDFVTALYELDNNAGKLAGILGIDASWYYRWESLSFGERKRFQLACALWLEPDILAVDEPTNHLDSYARDIIMQGLMSYRGIGLIVSHDRDLLDRLCTKTLLISERETILRQGGISAVMEELEKENLAMARERQKVRDKLKALKREESKRRVLAEGQQRRRSKKGIPIKDHDARFKKNLARVSGKDGTGGKLLRQMEGRIKQAEQRLEQSAAVKKMKTGISVGTSRSGSDFLLRMNEQEISMGEELVLKIPEITISPGDRTALTGRNGAGKSSLIHEILKSLSPGSDEILYLPQELADDDYHRLNRQLDQLSSRDKGEIISSVARLGSDPRHILESRSFSPGEARKLMLSFAIRRQVKLIILDEPTNHLDLPSITALEETLKDLDCAMLIVSHDRKLRSNLCRKEWEIIIEDENMHRLVIK